MIESGQWDPTDDIDEWIEPVFGPNETKQAKTGGRRSPDLPLWGRCPAGAEGARNHHSNPVQPHPNPIKSRTTAIQFRTQPNKIEQGRTKIRQTTAGSGAATSQAREKPAGITETTPTRDPTPRTEALGRRLLRAALRPQEAHPARSQRPACPKTLRQPLINILGRSDEYA